MARLSVAARCQLDHPLVGHRRVQVLLGHRQEVLSAAGHGRGHQVVAAPDRVQGRSDLSLAVAGHEAVRLGEDRCEAGPAEDLWEGGLEKRHLLVVRTAEEGGRLSIIR